LVLSTLHTNDSVSAIVRLIDLGIAGFLISSSVSGVLAQRLVRKLCACHTLEPASSEFQFRLAQNGILKAPSKMAVPGGCVKCDHTGYKGRVGIYELLRFDESIKNVIRTGGNIDQIREIARSCGMRSMQDDAIDKLLGGVTSIEEVLRVVPMDSVASVECHKCSHRIYSSFKFCPNCGARCNVAARTQKNTAPIPEMEGVFQA
jgi:type II secretory ATPase GspE/PulE/Tfp pilus assembly ATPase PilB-like protein